ncbi:MULTISPECIES: SusC/RagA family TonB-linked outer membrane protein [unclassified Flavobacterium]|uniref:SusC/RagA family TonB-linked outer membrane protein n=1 Tax=unclassified Flavobacterium TaxID=196869 RepID=UPI001F40C49B|nr:MULTISPECIES: SusC/RagA family TonB-linked outer membrane protein [unclassified Flavobacterium]
MKKTVVKQRRRYRIIKLTLFQFVLALIFSNVVLADSGKEQRKLDTKVTISMTNVSLDDALFKLEKSIHVKFSYNSRMTQLKQKVDIEATNELLSSVLSRILKPLSIKYDEINNLIVLQRERISMINTATESLDQTEIKAIAAIIIKGKVVDEKGLTIPGANVHVKGSTISVQTDIDGSFVIEVPSVRSVLVISFIGMETKEVNLGSGFLTVVLKEEGQSLNEVVVTAFGIRRKKNTLPYAAQQISGDDVNKTQVGNVASGLSGKISGLQITQGNSVGGSVNVVVRGNKSLTGNNQALFVVDGVPVDNSNTNSASQRSGAGGYDYGNAAADINPNDILSINVLKGAAASALYGSRAANGVIMITTKKPKNGLGISVNSGVTVGNIDKTTFVKYQQEYGAGRSIPQDKDGFLFFDANADGIKDLVVPTFAPRSWGPRYDPNLLVYDWEAFDQASPNYQKPKPWIAPKNGPDSFYQTAISTNHNVMIDGLVADKGSFKIGYSRNDERGVLPNASVLKNIVNLSASYNITNKLVVSGLVNYSQVDGKGRYGTGYDSGRNVNSNFRHFNQTNVDVLELKDAYFRNRKNITWNWADPTKLTNLTPGFSDNPYWVVYENYQNDTRNRVIGNATITYKVTDWLDLLGRVSVDTYSEMQQERRAVGSAGISSYSRFDRNFNETNYDLLATINKKLNDDFSLNALAGLNIRRNTISSIFSQTAGGLVVPKLYAVSNSKGTVPAAIESYQPKAVDGVFGGVTINYKELLLLDATLRRDKSSTLPEEANAYNYYAVSGSYIFYNHLQNLPWLSSGKLRLNYATVGNDAAWGSLRDVYDKPNPFDSTLLFSLPNTKNNSALKPENTISKEIGLEMSFFNNRIGFDASYYHTNTVDQIIPVAVSTAIGYSSKFINAGDIENKGIEVSIFATPVKGADFSWNVNLNFTRNRNKVLSLYNDSKNLQLGTFQGGVSLNASLGKPYGELQSVTYEMLNGERLIKDNGLYQFTTTTSNVIGNVNPDWIGGLSNSFRYKNFNLSFLIDVKKGGQLFSLDMYYGTMSGILPETVGLNDLGNPKRDAVANGGGIILAGVTANGEPNTKRVTIVSGTSGYLPQSNFVYDASFVKLREVAISYSLPKKIMSRIKSINEIEFSLTGRNLWLIHKNVPYADPEENLSSGNIQGYQSGSYPTVRAIGLNVKVKL